MTRISEIVVDTDLVDPKKKPNEEILYVDISGIDNKKGEIREYKRLTGSEAPSRARRNIKENDILVSTVRPNLNATAMVPKHLNNQVCSTGFCVLRSNGQVIPDYIYYYTRTAEFRQALSRKTKGASYPAVSVKDVKQVEIPIYPMEAQERIISVIKKAHSLMKKREQANHTSNEIIEAVFLRMFENSAKNSNDFKIGELKDVCEEVVVSFVGTSSSSFCDEDGVLFLRTTNVKPGKIDLGDVRYVSRSFHLKNRKSQIKSGDLLMTRVGLVGQTAIVPEEIREAHAGNVIIIRLKNGVSKKFYETLLNSAFIQSQIYRGRVGGVQPVFNTKKAMHLRIIVPPITLQNRFSSIAEKITALRERQEEATLLVTGLFNSLLSKAFKGELVR